MSSDIDESRLTRELRAAQDGRASIEDFALTTMGRVDELPGSYAEDSEDDGVIAVVLETREERARRLRRQARPARTGQRR